MYNKPIAIAYMRYKRVRSYEFTLFESSNTIATTKAAELFTHPPRFIWYGKHILHALEHIDI